MNAARRNWRLVAAGAVMLLALIAVGRLLGRHLGAVDAEVSRSTRITVRTEDIPVASGLALAAAGRLARPVQGDTSLVGKPRRRGGSQAYVGL